MELLLIRHGQTPGNFKKQYIGRTDESLCKEGRAMLREKHYPEVEAVIVSPMKRCIETAQILYPNHRYTEVADFRECDFGCFEGKTYEALKDEAAYKRWLESEGHLPFPQGESADAFKKRCCEAFEALMPSYRTCASMAMIIHGGTIMALLERYGIPQKSFYDYQVGNGCGFRTRFDDEKKQLLDIVELR